MRRPGMFSSPPQIRFVDSSSREVALKGSSPHTRSLIACQFQNVVMMMLMGREQHSQFVDYKPITCLSENIIPSTDLLNFGAFSICCCRCCLVVCLDPVDGLFIYTRYG